MTFSKVNFRQSESIHKLSRPKKMQVSANRHYQTFENLKFQRSQDSTTTPTSKNPLKIDNDSVIHIFKKMNTWNGGKLKLHNDFALHFHFKDRLFTNKEENHLKVAHQVIKSKIVKISSYTFTPKILASTPLLWKKDCKESRKRSLE